MYVEKHYREQEKIEEVRIHNPNPDEIYHKSPQVQKPEKTRLSNVMRHVPSDINIFLPIDGGEDYIIERIGWNMLERMNLPLKDVEGRKFSQISPFYYDILKDSFKEVYETGNLKSMRIFYYISDKIKTLANINIVLDEGEIYVISDLKNTSEYLKSEEEKKQEEDETKANLIEYFSQTGSYYKTRNEFTWTQGIYNIINLSKEPNDSYYNIIFDLVIP